MNLSNHKGESFDIEGIERGRSKVTGLKENWQEVFLGYYFGHFHLIGLGFWLVLPVGNLHPKG